MSEGNGHGGGPESRRHAGRFKKGQSGNPGGRAKVAAEFTKRCREAVDEYVIAMWIAEVKCFGKERVRCSELLAAYGYGKPIQRIEIAPEEMSDVELLRESREIVRENEWRLESAVEEAGAEH